MRVQKGRIKVRIPKESIMKNKYRFQYVEITTKRKKIECIIFTQGGKVSSLQKKVGAEGGGSKVW